MELYFKFHFPHICCLYKIEIDFSVLILYPETLINSLLRVFILSILWSFLHRQQIIKREVFFFFPFSICMLFILFYCAIVLTKTSSTVLDKSSKTGHP